MLSPDEIDAWLHCVRVVCPIADQPAWTHSLVGSGEVEDGEPDAGELSEQRRVDPELPLIEARAEDTARRLLPAIQPCPKIEREARRKRRCPVEGPVASVSN